MALNLALTKMTNYPKRLETIYNEQETTWNDLQRTKNDLKWPRTSKKWPETVHNKEDATYNNLNLPNTSKKKRKTANNKQILRFYFKIWAIALFSNTFSTQTLIANIQALLHRESRWKYSAKHFYIIVCIYYGM